LQTYNNIICCTKDDLLSILSRSQYNHLLEDKVLTVVRRGCYGTKALYEYDSLPPKYKQLWVAKHGTPKPAKDYTLLGNISTDPKAVEFYNNYILADGRYLPEDNQQEYILNASVLNAIHYIISDRTQLVKACGNSTKNIWQNMAAIATSIRNEFPHTLPDNHRRLKAKMKEYVTGGYETLISGKFLNKNTSVLRSGEQEALLRQLIRKHNNFDNVQISVIYNAIATKCEWKTISASTVGNYKTKWKLVTLPGRKGMVCFDNTLSMQAKREAPMLPLSFWSIDGWVAELLYQETKINDEGNSVTTYHNRLTIVVVLDAFKKYPIGYAIGSHESPALIREAVRNAYMHIEELTGKIYRCHQVQSDRYGKGTLTPFFQNAAEYYIPARAHNAKAKPIEPFFNQFNKKCCQFLPNWSGFGVASGSANQPNAEYLNKIKKDFPDRSGCEKQLKQAIELFRKECQAEYTEAIKMAPSDHLIEWSDKQYLYMLGETTGYTNRFTAAGLIATIGGEKQAYDTFDPKFRELTYLRWTLFFSPNNTDKVLAVDESQQYRFILEKKYTQPMALIDREEGDAQELAKIGSFNKDIKQRVLKSVEEDYNITSRFFDLHPELNDTTAKLLLTNSLGQHKDVRNRASIETSRKMLEKQNTRDEKIEQSNWKQTQDKWIDSKIDINDYLNKE